MAYRKLQFKNVGTSRSTEVIQEGELAVDESSNTLYMGDGSTTGGNVVVANVAPAVVISVNYNAKAGDTVINTSGGSLDVVLPTTKSTGDFIKVVAKDTILVKDGASTIVDTGAPAQGYVFWSGSAWEHVIN